MSQDVDGFLTGPSITSLADVKAVLDFVSNKFGNNGFTAWWRGQAKAEWHVVPSAFRGNTEQTYVYQSLGAEQEAIRRFRRQARGRAIELPKWDDHIGWLALAQHHGLATRLLDWSEALNSGLYFSVHDKDKTHLDCDAALWALCPCRLNQQTINVGRPASILEQEVRRLTNLPFGYDADGKMLMAVSGGKECDEKIVGFYPPESNERMQRQLGTFSVHGRMKPLDLIVFDQPVMIRFQVPATAKPTLQHELFKVGVRESLLFPDLDHLAHEISRLKSA